MTNGMPNSDEGFHHLNKGGRVEVDSLLLSTVSQPAGLPFKEKLTIDIIYQKLKEIEEGRHGT